MAEKTPASVQFQEVAMTAAQFTSQNPVLLKGQLGIETDTLMVKAGDESTAWTGRPYLQGGCPTGGFIYYAGTSLPSGYLPCDGRAVSRTTYSALYNMVGTVWGAGDGSTTFNLPNSFGRFPQHIAAGPNSQPYYSEGWNHYHYTGDFAIYGTRWAVGDTGVDVRRTFGVTSIGASGAGYTYALQCYTLQSSTSSRYGGVLARGNQSSAQGPYPKLNLYILIKY
ncbi:phage tail protein [Holdemanella porci]|uniref:phage tail protein n=1 Tax=Holdemanella porci TaxID=2652276 RepID=UPI003AB3EBE9